MTAKQQSEQTSQPALLPPLHPSTMECVAIKRDSTNQSGNKRQNAQSRKLSKIENRLLQRQVCQLEAYLLKVHFTHQHPIIHKNSTQATALTLLPTAPLITPLQEIALVFAIIGNVSCWT